MTMRRRAVSQSGLLSYDGGGKRRIRKGVIPSRERTTASPQMFFRACRVAKCWRVVDMTARKILRNTRVRLLQNFLKSPRKSLEASPRGRRGGG